MRAQAELVDGERRDDRRLSGPNRRAGRARATVMDDRGGAVEQPIVRRLVERERRRGKIVASQSAPAGGDDGARAGLVERAEHGAEGCLAVLEDHTSEADVDRLSPLGEEARELRRRRPAEAVGQRPPTRRFDIRRPFATARQQLVAIGEQQALAARHRGPEGWGESRAPEAQICAGARKRAARREPQCGFVGLELRRG